MSTNYYVFKNGIIIYARYTQARNNIHNLLYNYNVKTFCKFKTSRIPVTTFQNQIAEELKWSFIPSDVDWVVRNKVSIFFHPLSDGSDEDGLVFQRCSNMVRIHSSPPFCDQPSFLERFLYVYGVGYNEIGRVWARQWGRRRWGIDSVFEWDGNLWGERIFKGSAFWVLLENEINAVLKCQENISYRKFKVQKKMPFL